MSDVWRENGKIFGYPECCIEEFCNHLGGRGNLFRKFHGTGYVPCESCNRKTAQELLDQIAARRTYPKPFPEDGHKRKVSGAAIRAVKVFHRMLYCFSEAEGVSASAEKFAEDFCVEYGIDAPDWFIRPDDYVEPYEYDWSDLEAEDGRKS